MVHLMVMVQLDIYSLRRYQTFSKYYWVDLDVLLYFAQMFDFAVQENAVFWGKCNLHLPQLANPAKQRKIDCKSHFSNQFDFT